MPVTPIPTRPLDPESAEWLRALGASGAERETAYADLHANLVRIARAELSRRGAAIAGPERDDLAHQAAADALVSIRRRLPDFRGDSRFITWAYAFVVFEVSSKLGRHFWRVPRATMETEDWDRLPDRFGLDPARRSEWHELVRELRRGVDQLLSDRQRLVFEAIVLDGVPLDALVVQLGTTRNAIYKTLYDARVKLRAQLVATGHLEAAA
jgi:RNA polymerase sigma-70 factor, ECF subfamily